jgi:arginine N-succinyltransferase
VERESGRNRFRSVRTTARLDDKNAYLPARAKELLDAAPGAKLSVIPFD